MQRREPRRGRKLGIAFIQLLLLTGLCEATARVALAIPALAGRLWQNESLTWRRAWVDRHRDGLKLETAFEWAPDAFDATKGWLPSKNLRNARFFGGNALSTNSRGLRGAAEYRYEPTPGRKRILILGDSFTFGAEVADSETYAHRLQEMLPAAEIINMGVDGYGHDQMLIYFKEEGVKYAADIVILGFISNDIPRNTLAFRDYAKPKFAVSNGTLTLTNSPVPEPKDVLRWDWARPRLYDVWSLAVHRFRVRSGRYAIEEGSLTRLILDHLVSAIVSAGAVPVFAYLPNGKEIVNAEAESDGQRFLTEYCQANGTVKCFSALPRFAQLAEQGVRFARIGHWGAAGHLAAAEAIRDYLTAESLVASATDHGGTR